MNPANFLLSSTLALLPVAENLAFSIRTRSDVAEDVPEPERVTASTRRQTEAGMRPKDVMT